LSTFCYTLSVRVLLDLSGESLQFLHPDVTGSNNNPFVYRCKIVTALKAPGGFARAYAVFDLLNLEKSHPKIFFG